MSVVNAIGSYVHAWFGYVSWCFSATDLACRPFLAFVALLGASAGTLVLLCLALSRLLHDLAWDLEQRRREQGLARQAAVLREKIHAHAAPPATVPAGRIEPRLDPAAAVINAVENGWREVGIAGPTLTPPSPPAL